MSFIEVAKTSEITNGKMKGVMLGGKDILITNVDGKYYAIGGICTHAGGDLSKGVLNGKIVRCPRHGSKFDVTTGKLAGGPAAKDELKFEIKVEGASIKVNI